MILPAAAVIHLAAISMIQSGISTPEATYSVNADGAIHMARTAKKAGVRRFSSPHHARSGTAMAFDDRDGEFIRWRHEAGGVRRESL